MTADFSIKQHDTGPSYYATLDDSGEFAWNLVGATATFTMRNATSGLVVVDHQPCTVEDTGAVSGLRVLRYDWGAEDTAVADLYFADFEVTLQNNQLISFPDGAHLLVDVYPSVSDEAPVEFLTQLRDVDLMMRGLNAEEAEFAVRVIIPRAEAEARSYLQHALIRKERTETAIALDPSVVEVPLRYTPVASISAVSINGEAAPVDAYVMNRYGLYLGFTGATISAMNSATVTYVGGLDPESAQAVKVVILGRVARLLTKYRDDVLGTDQASAERYTMTYLSEGFTEDEKASLSPYRSQVGGLTMAQPNEGLATGLVDLAWS